MGALRESCERNKGPLSQDVKYRAADKSLGRPGKKQARKHVRDVRDFNNIETRAIIKVFFLQGKEPKEIHAILTETLDCFLPGRAKDLSATLYLWCETDHSFPSEVVFITLYVYYSIRLDCIVFDQAQWHVCTILPLATGM